MIFPIPFSFPFDCNCSTSATRLTCTLSNKNVEQKISKKQNEFTFKMRSRFGDAIFETTIDRKQAIALVEPAAVREIAEWFRGGERFEIRCG